MKIKKNAHKHGSGKVRRPSRFSFKALTVFILVFASVGSYFLWHAFACSVEYECSPPPPSNLRVTGVTQTSVDLAWDAAPDPQAFICCYTVFMDGQNVGGTDNLYKTTFTKTGLSSGSTHSFKVRDYTFAQEPSAFTNTVTATTSNPPPPPPPAPTMNFSANPSSVLYGGSSTLAWNSTNTTSCTASGSWSGSKGTAGSVSTGALIGPNTYSYNISCTGAGGTISQTVKVAVAAKGSTTPPPPPPKTPPSTKPASTKKTTTTSPAPPVSTPLTISDLAVTNITINSAKLTWQTNKAATSEVLYGPDDKYGQKLNDITSATNHSFALQPLEPGHKYHFVVKNTDSDGKLVQSVDQTFSTKGATLLVTVVNKHNDRVKGAKVSFAGVTKETDEKGQASFLDLPLGKLIGTMVYKNKNYGVNANIISADPQDQPQVAVFRVEGGAGGSSWLIWLILGAIVLVVVAFFMFTRFLRGKGGLDSGGLSSSGAETLTKSELPENSTPSFGSGPLFPPGWKPTLENKEQPTRHEEYQGQDQEPKA